MPEESRFWDRVDVGDEDECWEWQSFVRPDGYGRLWWGGDRNERKRAHRIAYQLAYGEIDGEMVLHHCDNRSCVNPNHLYAGSHEDNVQDAIERDRYEPYHPPDDWEGEDHPASKLTDAEVRELRSRYEEEDITQYELADEYGVHQTTVNKILNNRERTTA